MGVCGRGAGFTPKTAGTIVGELEGGSQVLACERQFPGVQRNLFSGLNPCQYLVEPIRTSL